MTSPCHIAFSTAVYLYLCTVLRIPLALGDALLTMGASLLPDLDISSSGIGRRVRPLSSWLERTFGHRTLTHSFVGIIGIAVLALPLLWVSYAGYGMLIIGYFSHPFLDMFSKEGVQFYWPKATWGVFPVKDEHRVTVGSAGEHVLLAGLIAVNVILYPIANVGLDRALHWMFADISGAVQDYHAYSPHYRVYADLEGTYRKIDTPVAGVYAVVDALNEYALLVDIDGRLCMVGTDAESHIVPISIRIVKTEQVTHYTQAVAMDGHTLGELSRLADVEHYLFGTLRTLARFEVRSEVIHYNSITRSGATLTLNYATYADISQMGLTKIPVLASNLIIETILPPDSLFKPFSFSQAGTAVFAVEVPIAAKGDVQVTSGQRVRSGALLAAHSGKLRDITLVESELETVRKLRLQQSSAFALREQEMAQEIVDARTERAHLETRQKAYQQSLGFEQELARLQQEVKKLAAQEQTLLNRRAELSSKDTADRLRYQQQVTELLTKKEALEAAAFTRAEFAAEVVNLEFQQDKCILYLRRVSSAD